MLTWVSYSYPSRRPKPPAPASILPRPSCPGFYCRFQRARQVDRFLGHLRVELLGLRISWVRVWRSCASLPKLSEPDGGNRPVVHVAATTGCSDLTVLLINPAIAVLKNTVGEVSNCSLRRCSLLIIWRILSSHVAVRLPSAWLLHADRPPESVNTLQAAHFVIE